MTDSQSESSRSTGGFFSGLVFGAAFGALGYFFLKTEDGKKAKDKLKEEWEKAKAEFVKSGIIKEVKEALPENVTHTIEHISKSTKKKAKVSKKFKVDKAS